MDENLLDFWRWLNHFNVRYIMVGGVAVNLHGYSRTTEDIDIWINDTKANRKQLGSAFAKFGYDELDLEDFQFLPGWTDFHIGPGVKIDVLINMKGIEGFSFDKCLELATIAEIENINVPFLHINHLIANKKAVNRPKDQLDVIELEKIIQLRKEMGLD